MVTLRAYQESQVQQVRKHIMSGISRVLLESPTGSGKTTVFSYICDKAFENGNRVFVVAHRTELVEQISKRLSQFGVPHGLNGESDDRVQVWSIGKLARRKEKHAAPDLLIIDECHHSVARTWAATKNYYEKQNTFVLGVTATPERGDGKGLHTEFDILVPGPSVIALQESGFLSAYCAFAPLPKFNTKGVGKSFGDYAVEVLAERINKHEITADVIETWKLRADSRPTVVFCLNVKHAQDVAQQFNEAGVPAAAIWGDLDPKLRFERLQSLRCGSLRVITNCELISEGFDCPALKCAILLRPTLSLGLHLQQCGRILRSIDDDKRDAVILDHVGNLIEHGLPCEIREWSLEDGCKNKSKERDAIQQLRMCQACYAVFKNRVQCPQCGNINTIKQKAIPRRDGELTEVDKELTKKLKQQEKAKEKKEIKSAHTREELAKLAAERGYKPGWVDIMWALKQRGYRGAVMRIPQ